MLYARKKNEDDAELTPFETPDEYYDWVAPIVAGLNRVVKRIKENKELTKSNLEWLEKAKEYGYPLASLKITKVAVPSNDEE